MVSVALVALLFVWTALSLVSKDKFEKKGIEKGPLFLIFRSKKGLEAINREAKKREKLLKRLGSFAVFISIPLMAVVFFFLLSSAGNILRTPEPSPGLAPILPTGVADIPGVPSVPVIYWFISIVVILVFHEVMHGLLARAEDVPLKSLGIFSVTLIPLGAFVEPDDEVLEKKGAYQKLRVYAAGSFGNFIATLIAGIVLALLVYGIFPLGFIEAGVNIYNVTTGSPAYNSGITANLTLIGIGEKDIENVGDFRGAVSLLKPGEEIILRTDGGEFYVTPEKREGFSNGFVGIAVLPKYEVKPHVAETIGGDRAFMIYGVFFEAFFWIMYLNFAVGLTNLLPIFPLDGGRMFSLFVEKAVPAGASRITTFFYLIVLVLVFINAGPLFGLFR